MHSKLAAYLACIALSATLGACAQSDAIDLPGNEDGDPQSENGICLLHNCDSDDHCGGCTEGRNSCLEAEHRCVACNADTGTGCPEGQDCSSWGNCVPDGLTCPTDDHGTPQITCASNADCAACDPMHLVCDIAQGACVACTNSDTSSCQSTDVCVEGSCAAACPGTCDSDADCGSCGNAVTALPACQAHKCSECGPNHACPSGEVCSPQGVCAKVCGTDGDGTCNSDADCAGCGAQIDKCHKPINGGVGECGASANGCSDIGTSVVVLPSPFDQVTNLCSNDGDCSGVGVTFNVGEMLRDLTGIDEINDANIEYPMNACAAVSLGDTLSCGVCVPCKVDSDCQAIDVDQVAGDAFGPLGSIVAAFLLDQIFGNNDHQVHMYCEQVAGDYGACVPCPGFLNECGVGGGGGGGGGGSCHDVCDQGGALATSCDSCAADVCFYDSYCCDTAWDAQCVSEVEQYCSQSCDGGGGGGGGPTCFDECTEGPAQDPSCNGCVQAICDHDAYCCDTEWDNICVGYVDQFCTPPC